MVVLLLRGVLLVRLVVRTRILCRSLGKVARRNLLRLRLFVHSMLFRLVLRLFFRRYLRGHLLQNRNFHRHKLPFVLGFGRLLLFRIRLYILLCRGHCRHRMRLGWHRCLHCLFLVLRIVCLHLRRSSLL